MPDDRMTSAAADVDGHLAPRRRRHHRQAPMLAVIAVGGAVGACTRYGLTLWLPHRAGAFPWSTFATNVSGCLLIGVLMVLVSEAWSAHRLVRPFLGTGVLGGYTTFSTYTVETRALLAGGHAGLGLLYLGATLVCALTAVYAGVLLSRWVTASRRPTDRRRR